MKKIVAMSAAGILAVCALPCRAQVQLDKTQLEQLVDMKKEAAKLKQATQEDAEKRAGAKAAADGTAINIMASSDRTIRTDTDGDWSFESGAASAMRSRRSSLESAGFAIISATVYKRSEFPWNYYYEIEYVDEGRNNHHDDHDRTIRTDTDGDWSFESGAASAMRSRRSSLESAGFAIISATVYKRSEFPWNYYYEIEYVDSDD